MSKGKRKAQEVTPDIGETVIVQFESGEGEAAGPQFDVPSNVSQQQLESILNEILENDDPLPYSFYINDTEITNDLVTTISDEKVSTENVVKVKYQPQAVFRVKAVTRCTSSLSGHTEAVLAVQFSPDGQSLASASGDTSVRVWDIMTQTPRFTCTGHKHWVLCIAWSPDGTKIASGSMDKTVRLWDPKTGGAAGAVLAGHTKWITAIAWEPMHKNKDCNRLVSASKDGQLRVWSVTLGKVLFSINGHTMSVTCVRWGGEGLIYSGSEDRSVKVWSADDGSCVRSLDGHAHWVNTMALSTDYVLRTGAFDHTGARIEDKGEAQAKAKERYLEAKGSAPERLVTGSDDFTMYLWEPSASKKPLARLHGHQQLVNQVSFSPDGRWVASASFDKSVRLWNGKTGKFEAALRGHVGSVYQVGWSGDSRMIVSGSKDSTMKVWDLKTKKLKFDLPGHADEVFTVDWSPDGDRVASGGKDKILKLWMN